MCRLCDCFGSSEVEDDDGKKKKKEKPANNSEPCTHEPVPSYPTKSMPSGLPQEKVPKTEAPLPRSPEKPKKTASGALENNTQEAPPSRSTSNEHKDRNSTGTERPSERSGVHPVSPKVSEETHLTNTNSWNKQEKKSLKVREKKDDKVFSPTSAPKIDDPNEQDQESS